MGLSDGGKVAEVMYVFHYIIRVPDRPTRIVATGLV